MIYKCVVRLLGTPKRWCTTLRSVAGGNHSHHKLEGVGPPNLDGGEGWMGGPLNRSCVERSSKLVAPNPFETQRARSGIDNIGQLPRVQRRVEGKVEGETGGACEDIQPAAFFSCRNT